MRDDVPKGRRRNPGEHLPEDGLVRPKHVAIKCDFIDILNEGETVNGLCRIRDGNE
jgi:hypothetical protein